MNTRYIISPLLALICSGLSWAQDLHKDITVEREITPTRREASRIAVLPSVTLSPVKIASLNYSSKVVTTSIPTSITTLDPLAWGDKIYTSPYRGYFDFGIGGPLFVGDVSAGYRILDTDKTRLSLWGQYNGDVYKRTGTAWHDHTASLGLDLHRAVGNRSFLDAGLDYTYGFHDMAALEGGRFSQSTSRVNAAVKFSSQYEKVDYSIGLRYGHFGYYNPHFPSYNLTFDGQSVPSIPAIDPYNGYEPVRQNQVCVSFDGRMSVGASSYIGMNLSGDFLATGRHYEAIVPFSDDDAVLAGSRTTGIVTINPIFETHSSSTTLRIGADVDFAVNSGKTVRVAPDVTLAWHGLQFVGVEVKAYGGSTLNALSSLYDISPYMNGCLSYRPSNLPYAFDAKVAFGPFLGGTFELFGGYAKANDWLMPVVSDVYPVAGMWESLDVKGFRYGARIGYDNGRTFAINLSYEGAPSKLKRMWYDNRDRARHIVSANVKLRPVDKLEVNLGYQFRGGRACYMYADETETIAGFEVYPSERVSLGAVGNLTLGVGASLTDKCTVFARGENLLGRKSMYIGGRPMQSVNGMVGVALKF